jgi:glycosyltransferase involved in cell wall biosynthesis
MERHGALVSIGIPVRNGARTLERAIKSVLAQDHEQLELVISDNASTDATDELCRDLASGDRRIVYHRHAQNVGLLNNFVHAIGMSRGTFFRWLGDDDQIAPRYISRCLQPFADDNRLVLVTSQIQYTNPDGSSFTRSYHGSAMRSDDRLERFTAFLDLPEGMVLDPLYALVRRSPVAAIRRRNMLREDEVFAAKLALLGPWGHVPEILGHRHINAAIPRTALARRLGVPPWKAYVATAFQCTELLRVIGRSQLTRPQRWRARAAIARMYTQRHGRSLARRRNKILELLSAR